MISSYFQGVDSYPEQDNLLKSLAKTQKTAPIPTLQLTQAFLFLYDFSSLKNR
jgi:hypothetical protein